MVKRIIINADDFGLSKEVNDAVADAAKRGVLSSATIMANMPGFDDAVRVAGDVPGLGVGIHLNIFRGRPVSDPADVSSLVNSDGRFLENAFSLFVRFLSGKVDPVHVERELSAQVEKVIESGIVPTHLDSEKHMHLILPRLRDMVCRAANKHGIRCVRVASETLEGVSFLPHPDPLQRLKAIIVSRRSRGFSRVALAHGLSFTDRFFGVAMTGRMTTDVYKYVFQMPFDGSIEIMCHPAISGGASLDAGGSSRLDEHRIAEYRALIDPETREALSLSGAQLINYGDL